jgi:hypothetical protein
MSGAVPPLPHTPSWRGAHGQIYLHILVGHLGRGISLS